jgi:hypothetical protein
VVLVQILAQKDLCHIGFQLGCILFLAFHSMFETLNKTFCLTVGCRVEWGRGNMLDTISLQNSWNSSDVNCGPLSVTTCAGTKKITGENGSESVSGLHSVEIDNQGSSWLGVQCLYQFWATRYNSAPETSS